MCIRDSSKRIWKFNEMDADHVTAWSKGGATDISNCSGLCLNMNVIGTPMTPLHLSSDDNLSLIHI